jgi:hypothetical protein
MVNRLVNVLLLRPKARNFPELKTNILAMFAH